MHIYFCAHLNINCQRFIFWCESACTKVRVIVCVHLYKLMFAKELIFLNCILRLFFFISLTFSAINFFLSVSLRLRQVRLKLIESNRVISMGVSHLESKNRTLFWQDGLCMWIPIPRKFTGKCWTFQTAMRLIEIESSSKYM